MTHPDAMRRLSAIGLSEADARVVTAHFADAERRGKPGHGFSRLAFVEGLEFDPRARPEKVESGPVTDRWHGRGALGYVFAQAIVDDLVARPPEDARLVIAEACFPTGHLGYWVRQLAVAGLVAVMAATSPRRLAHPSGGPPLTGTNPLAIAVPSSAGDSVVADVSMSAVTWGDVLSGRRRPGELVPFGGEHAHKAFALAVGLELLVAALAGDEHGAVIVVTRPHHDPVPAFRKLARGVRLPGDAGAAPA